VLTFQPALTAALANGDTGEIFSWSNVTAAASGDQKWQCSGVVVAPDGIADNYGGWVVFWGPVSALIKASTAVAKNKMLIADTGRLTISNTSLHDLDLAVSIGAGQSDLASDMIPVFMSCMDPHAVTA